MIMGDKDKSYYKTILSSAGEALFSQYPSLFYIDGPYELSSTLGETFFVEEFEGTITDNGQTFPYCALVAAAKGLGFIGIYPSLLKRDAKENILMIIRSLK